MQHSSERPHESRNRGHHQDLRERILFGFPPTHTTYASGRHQSELLRTPLGIPSLPAGERMYTSMGAIKTSFYLCRKPVLEACGRGVSARVLQLVNTQAARLKSIP